MRHIALLVALFGLACVHGSERAFVSNSSDSNSGNSSASDSGSNGSSDGSNGSSQGSADSSQGSADSSQGSANGTNASAETSNSSRADAAASTEDSSRGTSQETTRETSPSGLGPVISATTVGATVTGLGMLVWGMASAQFRAQGGGAIAAAWLRSHALDVHADLATGSGPFLDDLAEIAAIPHAHLHRFGVLLRRHRAELVPLATAEPLDAAQAERFLARVGALARSDPFLAAAGEAFAARIGHAE